MSFPFRFRPPSFKLQLVGIVAILLTVPVLVMIYDLVFAARTDDLLFKEIEHRLTTLGDYLGRELGNRLQENASLSGAKNTLVDRFYQLTEPVTQSYPGVRCGLFIPGSERIWVQGFLHEYRPKFPETPEQRLKRVYEESREGIEAVLASGKPVKRVGQTWDDYFLEYLVPVKFQGEVVAVVWAGERIHPAFAQSAKARLLLRFAILCVFTFSVVITLLTVGTFMRGVRRVKEGLLTLERDLGVRLPEMPGELGDIGRAINQLASRLIEREQMLEELRRTEHLAALGRLITEIAHELRAPVSIMQAALEVVRPKLEGNTDVKEALLIMEEQICRHTNLIDELLLFGRPSKEVEEINVNSLVEDLANSCRLLLERQGIELILNLAEEQVLVKGNKEKLRQVFLNLMMNAMQAMPGGGKLTIETLPHEGGVCVVVQDTGEGIPPEDLEHIFQPFFTRKAGGSGLGLALCHEIVRLHGGSISVESRPGQGAKFKIYLPAKSGERKENNHGALAGN